MQDTANDTDYRDSVAKALGVSDLRKFNGQQGVHDVDHEPLDEAPLSLFARHNDDCEEVIPRPLCDHLQATYETTDRSIQSLADDVGVNYTTCRTHVRGECAHRRGISAVECDVIRDCATDGGWSWGRIHRTWSFVGSARSATRHGRGECSCDATLPPAEDRPTPANLSGATGD